jgi:hypothetical protein
MSEVRDDDPSVNRGPVIQEGGIQDKGTGKFLMRFESLLDSTDSKDNNKPVFHLPSKEPQIAPSLITTRDTATTQTPAAAMIAAARTETQNAASAVQRITAATTTESPIAATAAQASTAEDKTPEFIDPSMPSPRGSEKLCSAITKEQAKEKVKERCTVQKRCASKGDPQHTLPCSQR